MEPLNASVANLVLLLLCLIIGAREEVHTGVLSKAADRAPVRNTSKTNTSVRVNVTGYRSTNPSFVCHLVDVYLLITGWHY